MIILFTKKSVDKVITICHMRKNYSSSGVNKEALIDKFMSVQRKIWLE